MYTSFSEDRITALRADPAFSNMLVSGWLSLKCMRTQYMEKGGPYLTNMGDAAGVNRWVATIYGVKEFADWLKENSLFVTASREYVGVLMEQDIVVLRETLEKHKTIGRNAEMLTWDDYALADFAAANMADHGIMVLKHGD